MRTIYLSKWNERLVAAVIENGKTMALNVCNDEEETLASIYKGIVKAEKANIDAYFVDIGQERDVFLHKADCLHSNLQIGEEVIVQIARVSSRYKSGQVTMKLTIAGRYMVYSPFDDYIAFSKKLPFLERKKWLDFANKVKREREGFLFRTAVSTVQFDEVKQELSQLREQMMQIIEKSKQVQAPALLHRGKDCITQTVNRCLSSGVSAITTDYESIYNRFKDQFQLKVIIDAAPPIDLNREIHRAMKKIVWLQDGSYLLIEENEALTVIDVNSGHSTLDPMTINQHAAFEAIRQLRLRNLGGMIVIDFLRMNEQEQTFIHKEVEKAAARDLQTIIIFGFTQMGLFELTRKKTGRSLKESLNGKVNQ